MQHSGWNTKVGHIKAQNFRFSQQCCWRFTFCRMWCCVTECVSTNILTTIWSLKHWEPHTPITQQGSSLHNFFYVKYCRSAHDFSTSIKLSTHPLKCSRDTDKDDTLYCESLFKFKPFLYSEITGPFSVKMYYVPGLDKVFGMFQLTHQMQQGRNKQQYEIEGRRRMEDAAAEKW